MPRNQKNLQNCDRGLCIPTPIWLDFDVLGSVLDQERSRPVMVAWESTRCSYEAMLKQIRYPSDKRECFTKGHVWEEWTWGLRQIRNQVPLALRQSWVKNGIWSHSRLWNRGWSIWIQILCPLTQSLILWLKLNLIFLRQSNRSI